MHTLPKTASDLFVTKQRGRWEELEKTLRRIQTKKGASNPRAKLTSLELRAIPRLYRSVSTDLAEARARQLAPDLLNYLNDLLIAAHSELHGYKAVRRGQVKRFLSRTVPLELARGARFIAVAAVLFFVPMAITFWVVREMPERAQGLLSDQILTMFSQMYESPEWGGNDGSKVAVGTAYYIQHDTSIAFLCFATGILAGIGSAYLLIYNGLFLGAIAGYITGGGFGSNFGRFVLAHSVFELSGIVLAGAAGLRLGAAVLKAGRKSRATQLRDDRLAILAMLTPAVGLIFGAALIEAFVSPSGSGIPLRFGFAAVSLVALLTLGVTSFRRRYEVRR